MIEKKGQRETNGLSEMWSKLAPIQPSSFYRTNWYQEPEPLSDNAMQECIPEYLWFREVNSSIAHSTHNDVMGRIKTAFNDTYTFYINSSEPSNSSDYDTYYRGIWKIITWQEVIMS